MAKGGKINILGEKWKYLIILDACRYDYFKKLYKNFLQGSLHKVISPANHTTNWLKRVFGDKKFNDIIYISANPYINSKGVSSDGFNASNHFYKVIDVWDYGWNEKLQTVHPKEVNKFVLKTIKKYPDKRFIIHYIQPHCPFLTLGPLTNSLTESRRIMKFGGLGIKLRGVIGRFVSKIIGPSVTFRILVKMGLATPEECEIVAMRYGKKYLRKAYENNLKIVLKYVSILVKKLPGDIVITSDHGEMLGEDNLYSHYLWVWHPLQLEVPWFEVKDSRVRRSHTSTQG